MADLAEEVERDAHVHRLGNLTLITSSLSSAVSNSSPVRSHPDPVRCVSTGSERRANAEMGLVQAVTCVLRRHDWNPIEQQATGLSRSCKRCGHRQFLNEPPPSAGMPYDWFPD